MKPQPNLLTTMLILAIAVLATLSWGSNGSSEAATSGLWLYPIISISFSAGALDLFWRSFTPKDRH